MKSSRLLSSLRMAPRRAPTNSSLQGRRRGIIGAPTSARRAVAALRVRILDEPDDLRNGGPPLSPEDLARSVEPARGQFGFPTPEHPSLRALAAQACLRNALEGAWH